jgi:hypothetical protein
MDNENEECRYPKRPKHQRKFLSRNIKYFGHIKRHSGLERTITEGMVAGRRGRGRPRRRWIQDIKERLNTSTDEV